MKETGSSVEKVPRDGGFGIHLQQGQQQRQHQQRLQLHPSQGPKTSFCKYNNLTVN